MVELRPVIYDIIIGIVSSVLGLLITQNVILALGLFALLGIAGFLLHFAIRFWRIRRRGGIMNVFKDQKSCQKLIFKRMATSHRVTILAVQAFHIVRPSEGSFYKALLKRKGKTGASVRLLLLDPEAHDYVRVRAKEIGEKEDDFVKFIRDGFTIANRLREEEAIDIQARFYSTLPIWQLFIFDDCLFASFYTSGAERHLLPHYQVAEGTPLYNSFVRLFNHLWETGTKPNEKTV